MVRAIEEVEPFVGAVSGGNSLGNSVQLLNTVGGVRKGRDKFQIPMVGCLEQATQGEKAVNILFHGGNLLDLASVSPVDLPVVPELRNVVRRGLDAQNEPELVIHLDGECTHTVLYFGSLDAGVKFVSHFALVIPMEFRSQESGDILGFYRVNGATDKGFIERFEIRLLFEDDVGGIFSLHDRPAIGKTIGGGHRTISSS